MRCVSVDGKGNKRNAPMYMKRILISAAIALSAFVASGCGPTIEHRKDESAIYYRMGVVHLGEKNFSDALKELTRAIELYPQEPTYHNAMGLAYLYKGMNREAIVEMKKAIELDTKFTESHVNLSAIYLADKNWDGAIAESQEAIRNIFYKTQEFAYFNMGQAYVGKGDYPAAVESYKKAVALNANYPLAWYSLGQTYDKMDKNRESRDAYEEALKMSPEYVDAYLGLGMALVKLKDARGAVRAFGKVVELAPDTERSRAAREYLKLIK